MDYSFIFRQLQSILTNNRITLIPLTLILFNLLIFIVSKTFRKTGLFLLALAFGLDYTIKSIPFDLYFTFPWLYNAVTILYVVGFLVFFIKIFKMLVKISKLGLDRSKEDSKVKNFLDFTGIIPFVFMIIVNIIGMDKIIDEKYIRILTSLSFIYMFIKTLMSTYKYLSTKENIILKDKMDFSEVREYLNSDNKRKVKSNSKNQGRKILKTTGPITLEDPTESLDISMVNKEVNKLNNKSYKEAKKREDKEYISFKDEKKIDEFSNINKLSNTDLLKIITEKNTDNHIDCTLTITNLRTGQKNSFKTSRPTVKILEHEEYKIDLEFPSVNEYDYGKFIDILLEYSKNKDLYKFELIVNPVIDDQSKVIFFDPSNIYDIDEKDYANVGGKVISMNFPKYKINFTRGN